MKRPKISIIGSGFVGSTTALNLALKELGDIVMLARTEGDPQGKALDMTEASGVEHFDERIIGTNSYEDTAESDIVIITAGKPRMPGMSRDDLLEGNTKVIKSVTAEVVKHSPNCILIVVTNPLDEMVYLAHKVSGFPKNRIMGMAGVLDSSRMKAFIAMEAGVAVDDINAFVLGGHGDSMVPLMRYANIGGIPVTDFLSKEKLDAIVERTRKAGSEIVSLLKTGSAYFAPAAAIAQMVESIIKDKKRVLPCSCLLEGEYGVNGIFIGAPAVLGLNGVEKVIEVELNEEEKKAFDETVKHVKELTSKMKL